ncbi:hypothetical protein CHELA40_12832 [Chelatococcus asaccharovorans]|nr:hypothetical protein CHELA40_12832 [Chelatococcus asaccharovorans]
MRADVRDRRRSGRDGQRHRLRPRGGLLDHQPGAGTRTAQAPPGRDGLGQRLPGRQLSRPVRRRQALRNRPGERLYGDHGVSGAKKRIPERNIFNLQPIYHAIGFNNQTERGKIRQIAADQQSATAIYALMSFRGSWESDLVRRRQ